MKSTRKKCLAILPIPALLICALAFGFGAYAATEEPSPLNKGALFTEAERDLDALSDLSGSKHITVRDGQDVEIGGAGIWIIDGMASDVTVSVSGAGIDWDGELNFTGGTVIIEGETVSEIPNANTHKSDDTGARRNI